MSHARANILKRSAGGDFDSLFLQLSDISSDCPSGAAKENCKIFLRLFQQLPLPLRMQETKEGATESMDRLEELLKKQN
jgi:hypothetical protein